MSKEWSKGRSHNGTIKFPALAPNPTHVKHAIRQYSKFFYAVRLMQQLLKEPSTLCLKSVKTVKSVITVMIAVCRHWVKHLLFINPILVLQKPFELA